MQKILKIGFVFWFSFFAPAIIIAQEMNCAVNLREAESLFDIGQIEGVPDLLTECLKSGFTREERIQAYKLLINAFIFDDNLEQAENYTLEFLNKYPEYEIVATDPSEFVNLLEEFNNDARASIGLSGGLNFSNVRIIEPFGVNSLVGLDESIAGR